MTLAPSIGGWFKTALTADSDKSQYLEIEKSYLEPEPKFLFVKGINPGELSSVKPAILAVSGLPADVDLMVFVPNQRAAVGEITINAQPPTALVKLKGLDRVLKAGTPIHVQVIPRNI
jgi:hypothetical protein